ncbi:cingulin-like [Branchiostoma lanceolatum]|uniref:cingulin-like n=1 Tax=Branchiostoma lanceolatum TaxID=7740 RepID=UPI003456DE24
MDIRSRFRSVINASKSKRKHRKPEKTMVVERIEEEVAKIRLTNCALKECVQTLNAKSEQMHRCATQQASTISSLLNSHKDIVAKKDEALQQAMLKSKAHNLVQNVITKALAATITDLQKTQYTFQNDLAKSKKEEENLRAKVVDLEMELQRSRHEHEKVMKDKADIHLDLQSVRTQHAKEVQALAATIADQQKTQRTVQNDLAKSKKEEENLRGKVVGLELEVQRSRCVHEEEMKHIANRHLEQLQSGRALHDKEVQVLSAELEDVRNDVSLSATFVRDIMEASNKVHEEEVQRLRKTMKRRLQESKIELAKSEKEAATLQTELLSIRLTLEGREKEVKDWKRKCSSLGMEREIFRASSQ